MDEFNFEGILNDRTRVTGPWFCENCVILSCLHSSNHKYLSIFMKLYHNVYGHKISDEFDYGRYPTSMSLVICPWISKNAINHFVYTLGPSFLHQSWLFFIQHVYYYKKFDEFNFEGILNDRTRVTGPWFYENCVILSCLHSSNHKLKAILMAIRSRMSFIMGVVCPVSLELSALELVKML